MVRVRDMLKKKRSLWMKTNDEEACAMFRAHATTIPGEDGVLGVDRKMFPKLMRALVAWANKVEIETSIRDNLPTQPLISKPNKRDLRAAFELADADKSGYVDEEEFLELFSAVLAGRVRGLGDGIEFYRRPTQHMRWGDDEFHPDTDWQDLFFDLLFAGGAFCGAALLSESLVNGQEVEGFGWFCAMFMCLAQQWVMRIHLSSRFASTSMFHAVVLEQLEFCLIALATWHIPLADINVEVSSSSSYSYNTSYSMPSSEERRLADSTAYGSGDFLVFTPVDQLRLNIDGCAFGFSFFLGVNTLLYVARWSEILFDPAASAGAKNLARFSTLAYTAVAGVFFVAAAICHVAGPGGGSDDGYSFDDDTASVCVFIWFAANIMMLGSLAFWVWIIGNKPVEEAHSQSVPMCVTYLIIRVGEWTMVMLGETVLSLLGVPLKRNTMVYLMFTCTMLVAGNIQFQGYMIHPIHAEHHVLQGGQFSFKGYLYLIWATIWYAMILVLIGTGAKVLTKKATYGKAYEGANWCLCGGLAAAFISNMTFQSLHQRDKNKELGLFDCFTTDNVPMGTKGASSTCSGTDKISFRGAVFDLGKAGTLVLLFALAIASQEPNITVFGCYFVAMTQSMLVLYEHSSGLDHPERDSVSKEKNPPKPPHSVHKRTSPLAKHLKAAFSFTMKPNTKAPQVNALAEQSTSSFEQSAVNAAILKSRNMSKIVEDNDTDANTGDSAAAASVKAEVESKYSISKSKKQDKQIGRQYVPRKFDGLRQGSSRSVLKANLKEHSERVSRERLSKSPKIDTEPATGTKRTPVDRPNRKVGKKETQLRALSENPDVKTEQV